LERKSVFQVMIYFLLALLVVLTVAALFLMAPLKNKISEKTGGQTVQSQVLRFHVRANSDCEEDQAVKMKVKEAVLEQVKGYLQQDDDKAAVKKALQAHLEDLVRTAREVLQENGYGYGASAYFTREEFPIKRYGDLTFPAGVYDALRIDLGKAQGHNWWCMLYPSLCFVDVTYGVVPQESKDELKNLLGGETYSELLQQPDTQVQVRSAVWDFFEKRVSSH